ncbi:MAG: trypsin-like peptidase domain-containing protein [Xanthomonadales bacterium]
MTKSLQLIGFLARAIMVGLAIAFVVIYLWPSVADRLRQQPESPVAAPATAPAAPVSYAEAVNRAAPAVVSIYTQSLQPQSMDPDPAARKRFRYLYRMRSDMGSGVLLSEDGYILTNQHVVNQVHNIRISLWDGRIAPAKIVGSDPETDLAVLKINLTGLPTAPIAEQSEIHVGDVVLAIGNALGLSHTVTMGIISATGRNNLRSLLYEDFIQTDAAINAGNSGGALINANGDLIGINSRKLGGISGAQNIGFATPITQALDVMNQIIEYGSVRRGWLGATFGNLRPTSRSDGSSARRGISVREVARDGPAWNAGIRQGDIILKVDGERVADASQFLLKISRREPGSQVELEILRRRETFETYATLIQQPPLK